MGEDLLSLKWNNHKPAFFHLLRILREKGCYTDVTLACGTKFFAVHRLVLMACSDFFNEVFEHTQCQKPVIVLKDIKGHELEALLDYMYLGEVDVQQTDLPGLIKAAECLRIKGLAVPDEDPTQTSKHEAQTSGERPSKRRRQDRDGRDDRGSLVDRGMHSSTNTLPQYSHQLVGEVVQSEMDTDGNSNNIALASEDPSHLPVHEVTSQSELHHMQKDQNQSPSHGNDNRLHHETRLQEAQVSQDVDTYPHATTEIKTEHCEVQEDIENGGLKSEVAEVRSDPMNESPGGGGDFSHFLSVEENLAHHMFQQTHQAGTSGIHRQSGRDGSAEVNAEDGTLNRGAIYSTHLLGEVVPEGTTSHANQSGTNGGPGGFFPREAIAQHHCPYCPQSFMFQSILKRHLRTHTGEKPYECPKCDYRSAYKYHVARHMKLHNNANLQQTESTASDRAMVLSAHTLSLIQTNIMGSQDGLSGSLNMQNNPGVSNVQQQE